jgi:hypothetical protein
LAASQEGLVSLELVVSWQSVRISAMVIVYPILPSFLPLGATAQDELWPPEQSASILLYSGADCLVSQQFSFYGVRFLASRPTTTWSIRIFLFVWLLPLDMSGMGDPTNSYATVGIALRVSRELKHHHHDKVETPSLGVYPVGFVNSE